MIWDKKDIPQDLVKNISSKYGCDLLTASILVRRGVIDGENIKFFLEDDPRHLRNPFELPGMEDAVERIILAKEEGERVLIFGDRDVDGITSVVLLWEYLSSLGMDVRWRLPTGDEPYGLTMQAVEEFASDYGTLIITVDCGISCVAEIDRANELGIQVIITDHHNPQEQLPDALAIVNPKLGTTQNAGVYRDLAGCGVAYKLVSSLRFALKSEIYGHTFCLLNIQPINEAFCIEIAKIKNLIEIDRLAETVMPGMASIEQTRIPEFLAGQQIFVWDSAQQKKTLTQIFGNKFDIYLQDISGEIGKEIPQTAGKSLLRIRELSRLAKYSDKPPGELDVFINLFATFIQHKERSVALEDREDLQLAALGTIADLMPLRDENRIIVRCGLASLMERPRPGLLELLFKLGLSGRRLGTEELSWQVCPALNAAGRMGCPEKAAELLVSKEPKERERIAAEIIQLNEERKKLGGDIWAVVEPRAAESLAEFSGNLVLAYGEEIYRGITGIMANRLTNRFKVPALVVSFGESILTGSLRSVRGYDLHILLEGCADLFLDWGGHTFAAGFSMASDKWGTFLQRLKTMAATIELSEEDSIKRITIDAELPHAYLTPDVFALIDRFEPYGEENGPLIFMARGLTVMDIAFMGKQEAKHVKLTLDAGSYKWPAVYWQAAEKVKRDFDLKDRVDLVFTLNRNWFNGSETPQIIITDLKRTEAYKA